MATRYQYTTVLRAECDDPHWESDVQAGDIHIKPGKHLDGHSYTVTTPDQNTRMSFETVAIYKGKEPMNLREAINMARNRHFESGVSHE